MFGDRFSEKNKKNKNKFGLKWEQKKNSIFIFFVKQFAAHF